MDATWRTRVGEILTEALARSDDARDEYVREACGGDNEVEAEVRALGARDPHGEHTHDQDHGHEHEHEKDAGHGQGHDH